MKHRSIRFRLMLIMICITTIPVTTLTIIATNNTRNSVRREIISANSSRMEWANQYLNELIQQIDTLFYTLQINQKLMNDMTDIESDNINIQFNSQKYIQDTLTSSFYANSGKIDDITLYIHENKKAFSVNYATSGMIQKVNIKTKPWYRILKTPINMYFKQTDNSVFAVHSINRFPDKKLLGGLSVKINREVWEQVSSILESEKQSSIYLMNDEGEILQGSTRANEPQELKALLKKLNQDSSDLEIHKTKQNYYFLKRVGDGQLILVKELPLKLINKSAYSTMMAGLITGGLFALISLILSIFMSLRISRPIISLAKTMSKVQIQSFEMKQVHGSDEIGLLERCYNSMMQRIKELIEEEYEIELELKNAQLQALQAQINPHFLNNTLQLIGGMALSSKVPIIYNISRVIADLLRYSISTEENLVPLKEELIHMKNYIYIQEQRFLERCKVNIIVDELENGIKVPKFTLQPIVENAFEHGLQKKVGAWNIEIRVKQTGKRVFIIVKDNGIGIGEDELKELRCTLKRSVRSHSRENYQTNRSKRSGIGLRNVNDRIKLQFGEKFHTRIYSKQGNGTIIVLVLPF